MVCGYSPPYRRRLRLVMLKAYFDASGNGADDVFVMAGYVAGEQEWSDFSYRWNELLGMRSPHYRQLEAFKMSQMQSEADRERCGWFYRVIEEHARAAIAVVVPVQALAKAVDDFGIPRGWSAEYRQKLKNPYYYAFRQVVDICRKHPAELGAEDPIDLVFDNESESRIAVDAWFTLSSQLPPDEARMLAGSPQFKSDTGLPPLQAADLLAWWVRHWHQQGNLAQGFADLAFPWKVSVPLRRGLALFDSEKLKAFLQSAHSH